MLRTMLEPTSSSPRRRSGQLLRDAWHKYGLIVIGNMVFFALLYFVQYRPNSRDNRAAELLSLAQHEETDHRLEAAEALYSMVATDYADNRPALIAAACPNKKPATDSSGLFVSKRFCVYVPGVPGNCGPCGLAFKRTRLCFL